METVLIVVHLLLAIGLVGVVLLQKSEGGGLGIGGGGSGGGGGMSGFMTGRATADLLTRTTAILATAFMITSLVLAILAAHDRNESSGSILDRPATQAPVPTQPSEPAAPLAK